MTDVADLIIRGLGGQHLHGFLPGRDNKAAISSTVTSCHGWMIGAYGQVTRKGIGEWPYSIGWEDRKPANALRFVTWREVLDVIARGCGDGHRQAYETAYHEWFDKVKSFGLSGGYVPPGDLHDAEHALIRHGCTQTTVQDALF